MSDPMPAGHVRLHEDLLRRLGHPLAPGARVLDFGCGEGGAVRAFRDSGYDAFGCDIAATESSDHIRQIEVPYRVPFADATFDLVCSDQVLEHVQDHDLAFREISRVLKPGAPCLHLYPPKWRPREVHTHVPLAGAIQTRPWLRFWAWIGIRNEFQAGATAADVVERNHAFLLGQTNYLPRRRLAAIAERHFSEVRYVERAYLTIADTKIRALRLGGAVPPPLARLYSGLRGRLLFTVR